MKTRQAIKTLSRSLALLSGAAVVQTVGAQSALEEIVVTATHREENLQDVPVSVSALGAHLLAAGGVAGADGVLPAPEPIGSGDIALLVPSPAPPTPAAVARRAADLFPAPSVPEFFGRRCAPAA